MTTECLLHLLVATAHSYCSALQPQAMLDKSLLQLWLRSGVMAYFLLCMILLWLVNVGSCASNKFVWTGIMPMHVSCLTHIEHAHLSESWTRFASITAAVATNNVHCADCRKCESASSPASHWFTTLAEWGFLYFWLTVWQCKSQWLLFWLQLIRHCQAIAITYVTP